MAMALHFCVAEIEAEAELAPLEGETKPRKRAEKDVTVSANRLRLLFTCGAHGTITTTAKEVNSARAFAKAWSFGPLKPRPVEEPEPIPVILASDLEDSSVQGARAGKTKKKVAATGARRVAQPKPAAIKKTKAVAKPAAKAKAVAKKSATKKVAKKVAKKAAAKPANKSPAKSSSRSAGGTRPRPARPTRKRSGSKKSSRRS